MLQLPWLINLKMMNKPLDRDDCLALLIGTNGPGDYSDTFQQLGQLDGFPNERWSWRHDVFDKMTTEQLYNSYIAIKEYKKR